MAFNHYDSGWSLININDETKYKTIFEYKSLIVKKRIIQNYVFLLFIDNKLNAKFLYKHSWEYQLMGSIKELINNINLGIKIEYYLEYKNTNYIKIIESDLFIDYSNNDNNIEKTYNLENKMLEFLNSLL